MQTLLQDLRYGFRTLSRERAFAAVSILTLAVALGANSAIFTLVNAILLRPLPFANADRVVRIENKNLQTGNMVGEHSYPNIVDVGRMKSVEAVAAFSNSGMFLMEGDTEPELIIGTDFEASAFTILGTRPALGRFFNANEDRPGAPRQFLISDELWRRRFGADPKIIGRSIHMGTNRTPWTVIGVMPPGFRFPAHKEKIDYYAPLGRELTDQERNSRDLVFLGSIALLKPGVSVEAAQAEAEVLALRLEKQFVASNSGTRFLITGLHANVVKSVRPALLMLFGAVGVVLLIGCANVANLLLARAAGRHREISIRSAVGASRGRIIRQLLVESILLSVLAGGCGLLLAAWGIDALVALAPPDIPRLDGVELDTRVLLFTLTLSVLTGIVFGLAPALAASKINLTESLKEATRGSTEGKQRNRIRNVLVTAAMALSVVLLTGAGLLLRSFMQLSGIDPGFDYKNVAVIDVPARAAYKTQPEYIDFQHRLQREFATIPGVTNVGATTILPLSGGQLTYTFQILGRTPFPEGQTPAVTTVEVTPNYFRTMGIPLLRGRDVNYNDKLDSPGVVVVNEAFVRQHFRDQNPIGHKVRIDNDDSGKIQENEIVGVVGNVKYLELIEEPLPIFYLPYAQTSRRTLNFVVRGQNAAALASLLKATVHKVDRQQPIIRTTTLEEMRGEMFAQRRFSLVLLSALSVIALLLAAVGIYSIMSYSVTQRTSEIGIRMALGAEARDIFRLVVGQALKLVIVGIGTGIVAALLSTRLMSSLLYGVAPSDPATLIAICVVIAGAALLASWIPARRAARVDPLVAIRYD